MLRTLARGLGRLRRAAPPSRPRPLAEAMEPRLLYSAELAPGALLAGSGLPAAETRSLDLAAQAWLAADAEYASGGEILFIDAAVDDADALIEELRASRPGLEVIRLDAGRDGIEQIGEVLAQRAGLGAVHILSHGASGQLHLGNGVVDGATLDAQAARIARWAEALGADADILLYGCDVAAGADGDRFIDTLARLTGADVAASSDRTGAAQAGGNWVLERHSGRIEAAALASLSWQGSLGVSAASGDIALNTTTLNTQNNVAVAMLDNGSWLAVWEHDFVTTGQGIVGRLFAADGTALSAEFVVNETGPGNQTAPAIASDGSGKFVVTWVSDQNGNRDIYARRLNALGFPIGNEILVNSGATSGDQQEARVAMSAEGDFVVTWTGVGPGDSDGVFARQFNSAGQALGSVFRVNVATSNTQINASVAMADDGRFVVTWMDEGANKTILARTYSASGVAGNIIEVNKSTRSGDAKQPDVAMAANGNFVVVWTENGIDNGTALRLQVFDASGTAQGSAIKVNVYANNDQERARIAMNARGDFVVAWESNGQDGDSESIVLRSFEVGGLNPGPEIVANTYTKDKQEVPAVALNNFGQFVVVWQGERSLLSSGAAEVNGKTFTWPEAAIVNSAPVLNTSTAVALSAIDEDSPSPTGAVGWSVSDLVSFAGSGGGPQNVTDPDAGAVTGIALIAADAASGQWRYSTDGGGTWTLINAATLSSANALLLAADGQTRLHYTPNADTNGTLATALSFRAWDRSSGSNGSFASTTANGGSTAFSTATGSATLTVNAVNDVPVITVNQLTIAEGASVVLNSSMLNATDAESGAAALTYSVVSVSGGFFALGAAPTIAITSFTQAQVNAGSVVFTHDGNEAAPAYSLTVSDPDGGTSAAAPATIGFTNVNDAPTILGSSPDITVVKLNGAPSGAVGVTISSLVSRSGSGSGPQNIGDPDAGAMTGIAITAADTSKGTWWYSTNGGTTWTALGAVSGTSARLLAADGNTRLYFQETLNSPGTVANSLSFRAWDRSSGANGSLADASINGGSTAFSANTGSVSLNVQFINIAPTLTATGTIVVSTLEDAPDPTGLGAVGFLVSSLVSPTGSGSGPQNTADVDGDSVGIALVGITQANGSWWFSIDGGNNWSTVGSASTANALLLANDVVTRLYYQPGTANDFGTAKDSLTFRAWDGSASTNGGRADTTLNGGNTAFSNTTDSASLTITAVNDVPVIGTNQLSIAEGTTVVLNGTMLNATDVESDAAELTYSVVSVSGGFFALGAAPATAISSFTQAQVNAGNVIFIHDGNEAAPAYTLTVRDGDGADSAASPAAIGFTNVNDAPTLAATGTASLSVDEDHGAPVGDEGAPVSALVSLAGSGSGPQNVADPDAAGLTGIAIIAADTTNGSWFYSIDDGASWNALGTVSTNNARLLSAGPGMRIAFQANPDYNGTTPDALRFLAWDQTSGSNGGAADTTIGSAFSTTSDTLTLIVRPVNDAPTATTVSLGNINEDGSRLITQADLLAGAADIDGDALTAINLDLSAGSGSLVDNGDGTWTFTPTADWSGAVTFGFDVYDGTTTVANTASLSVVAVNDAPTVAPINLGSINEDGSRLITQAQLLAGAADVDGDPLTAINLALTAGSGNLIDNGNGTWTFTPTADWNGPVSFSFEVDDSTVTVANTAFLGVVAANDAPTVIQVNLGSINEDGSRLITQAQLLAGAADVDGDPLSAINLALTSGSGMLIDNLNGTWTFVPTANWYGAASFAFAVSDGTTSVANTATLGVLSVNDAPTAVPINLGSMAEDGSRLITQAQLLAGAADVDGDALSAINLALTGGSGNLINNGNGTWTFTPASDWHGLASFGFAVSDGTTTVANTATLLVSAVNDAPIIVVNRLVLAEGQTVVVTASDLRGIDVDTPDSALTYGVSGLSGGYFALAGAPAAAIASFTQAQVNAGEIRFVHDGGEAAPSYVLTLSDGSLSSAPSAASIGFTNVNDAPSVSTPTNQSIDAGAGFGPVSFTIGDAETAADALQVRVRSSNQAVLPDAALRLSGSGASRSLTVLAGYAGVAGSTSVIIEVSDGSATTSTAFTVSARALPPAAEPPPRAAEPAPEPAAPAPQAAPAPAAEPPIERPAPTPASAAEPVSAADERVDAPVVPLFAFAPPVSVSTDSAEIAVENIVNVGQVSITLSTADVLALMYTAPELTELSPLETEISRSLRESRLDQAFSQLRDAAHSEERGERQTVAVATVTGAGLTIGYVAWVIRGGVLVSSLLTTMPAWRLLDPLPILDGSGGDGGGDGDDGDNDDSLQSLVEANAQHRTEAATAHDAGAPAPSLQEESPR